MRGRCAPVSAYLVRTCRCALGAHLLVYFWCAPVGVLLVHLTGAGANMYIRGRYRFWCAPVGAFWCAPVGALLVHICRCAFGAHL